MQSPVRHLDMNAGSSREAEAPADLPLSPTGPKSANPLTDLIDTEHIYVEQLASVIRRVAGAWSRTNFPPKELDQMFRAMEGCFRANRALLVDLEEIGPNPSSPKALGDLLMRWVSLVLAALLCFSDSRRSWSARLTTLNQLIYSTQPLSNEVLTNGSPLPATPNRWPSCSLWTTASTP